VGERGSLRLSENGVEQVSGPWSKSEFIPVETGIQGRRFDLGFPPSREFETVSPAEPKIRRAAV